MDVDWQHSAGHAWSKHQVSVDQADEALADPDALLYDPDPTSKSGVSARLIGYSPSAAVVLVVIIVRRADRPGAWWGATGWRANSTDRNTYRQRLDERDSDER